MKHFGNSEPSDPETFGRGRSRRKLALERAEHDDSFYNSFSIALYVIGWGLGFLGIILGFGKPTESE